MRYATSFSSILEKLFRREMGRKLFKSVITPFPLCMGVMTAFLNNVGKVEVEKDELKIKDKGPEIGWMTFLITVMGISSSPHEVLFCRPLTILMISRGEQGARLKEGMEAEEGT